MAAPDVNGRLYLTGVHQKPPASLLERDSEGIFFPRKIVYSFELYIYIIHIILTYLQTNIIRNLADLASKDKRSY